MIKYEEEKAELKKVKLQEKSALINFTVYHTQNKIW